MARPSESSTAASTHAVPGAGDAATSLSFEPAAPRTRSLPRSGYDALTALTLTSRVAPPLSSGARPMLGKSAVVAVTRPSARAFSASDDGIGWSLRTTASPPSIWRASRARPPLMRSAKKPTAVSAPTASVTATTSSRNSPARKSRSNWRQPSRHADGARGTGSVGMATAVAREVIEPNLHES